VQLRLAQRATELRRLVMPEQDEILCIPRPRLGSYLARRLHTPRWWARILNPMDSRPHRKRLESMACLARAKPVHRQCERQRVDSELFRAFGKMIGLGLAESLARFLLLIL
jgi:hypothetical protein